MLLVEVVGAAAGFGAPQCGQVGALAAICFPQVVQCRNGVAAGGGADEVAVAGGGGTAEGAATGGAASDEPLLGML